MMDFRAPDSAEIRFPIPNSDMAEIIFRDGESIEWILHTVFREWRCRDRRLTTVRHVDSETIRWAWDGVEWRGGRIS